MIIVNMWYGGIQIFGLSIRFTWSSKIQILLKSLSSGSFHTRRITTISFIDATLHLIIVYSFYFSKPIRVCCSSGLSHWFSKSTYICKRTLMPWTLGGTIQFTYKTILHNLDVQLILPKYIFPNAFMNS